MTKAVKLAQTCYVAAERWSSPAAVAHTRHDDREARGTASMSLEDRVTALEAQMAETRRLAGEARLLASGAHEESGTVSSALGAHGRLINGWGEQINARIDTLDNHVTSLDRRMASVESRMDGLAGEIRDGFAQLAQLVREQRQGGTE